VVLRFSLMIENYPVFRRAHAELRSARPSNRFSAGQRRTSAYRAEAHRGYPRAGCG
jgi:hypothetical protein